MTHFPHIRAVSTQTGISESNLAAVFRIERRFHRAICRTEDAETRKCLYAELYASIHPLLHVPAFDASERRYARLVRLFHRELSGKSVLDIGCGDGGFLQALHKALPHKDLCGLDISPAQLQRACQSSPIQFIRRDVVEFSLEQRFDVVFSNQVFEHIAPADVPPHLQSVLRALRRQGTFILLLPNKHWGPADMTRILDNTFSGRITAQGAHLNESSYADMIRLLRRHGFENIETTLPFAQRLGVLGDLRVQPIINLLFEKPLLRRLTYAIRLHRQPIFRNPVLLLATKP